MKYFFIILFSLGCFWLSAQSEYRTHTVQKGETLYGIGKNYGLSEQELFLVNPNLNGASIKEGDIVVIPAKKIAAPQVINRIDSNYVKHQVQPKETLYGLSKRYGISIDEILKENPNDRDYAVRQLANVIWMKIIYVIIGVTFLTYLLTIFGLKYLSATISSAYIYTQPVMVLLFTFLFAYIGWSDDYRHTINAEKILYMFVIFTGVYLTSKSTSKQ